MNFYCGFRPELLNRKDMCWLLKLYLLVIGETILILIS